jgi:hypothetical protein
LAEEGLRESRRSFESELRQAQWLRQDLEDEKKAWKERVEQEVTRGIAEFVDELDTLRQTNSDQRAEIQLLKESVKSVGNRSASDMAIQIENQKKMIDSLQTQLADAPSIEERSRSKKLQSENDRLFQELERIQQENQVLHLRAGKASIGVAELESLRDQRAAWECRELGYRAMIADLKADIEQYRSEVNNKEVFNSCSDADKNPNLQNPPLIRQIKALDLSAFSDDVRNLIGLDKGLFYRPQDIRSFIGGLAACRLHILQGISGTGKTSLPRAFADVMNWGCEVSEVQSGWRDKNDLLGYYNTFEKKFYESPFFKHLYKACCPAYESRGTPQHHGAVPIGRKTSCQRRQCRLRQSHGHRRQSAILPDDQKHAGIRKPSPRTAPNGAARNRPDHPGRQWSDHRHCHHAAELQRQHTNNLS